MANIHQAILRSQHYNSPACVDAGGFGVSSNRIMFFFFGATSSAAFTSAGGASVFTHPVKASIVADSSSAKAVRFMTVPSFFRRCIALQYLLCRSVGALPYHHYTLSSVARNRYLAEFDSFEAIVLNAPPRCPLPQSSPRQRHPDNERPGSLLQGRTP